jgi:hypothetical protein
MYDACYSKHALGVFITITESIPLLVDISSRGYHLSSNQCFDTDIFIIVIISNI